MNMNNISIARIQIGPVAKPSDFGTVADVIEAMKAVPDHILGSYKNHHAYIHRDGKLALTNKNQTISTKIVRF